MSVEAKRRRLISYYCEERTDWPREMREEIGTKLLAASDASIATDRSCVGKHWILMRPGDRDVCPYCGWQLA